jgi:hypothetical protein
MHIVYNAILNSSTVPFRSLGIRIHLLVLSSDAADGYQLGPLLFTHHHESRPVPRTPLYASDVLHDGISNGDGHPMVLRT